jgi:hypothetical protein
VSVSLESGKTLDVFTVQDCADGGLADLAAVGHVGALEFPLSASDGQEFHLFSIATARGGNAVASNDYWLAALTPEGAWGAFITSADPLRAEFKDPVLILEQPSTTTSEGERVSISSRRIEPTPLPRLPSRIVSQRTEIRFGLLSRGYHATNWRPVLSEEKRQTIIDHDGPCRLPETGAPETQVEVTVSVAKWSDGRTELTCVAVRPVSL